MFSHWLTMAWYTGVQGSWGMTLASLAHHMFALYNTDRLLSSTYNFGNYDEGKLFPVAARWEGDVQSSNQVQNLGVAIVGFDMVVCGLATAQGSVASTSILCFSPEITAMLLALLVNLAGMVMLKNCKDAFTQLHGALHHDALQRHESHPDRTLLRCSKDIMEDRARQDQATRVCKRIGRVSVVATVLLRLAPIVITISHSCMTYRYAPPALGAVQLVMGILVSVTVLGGYTWGDYDGCPHA